MPYGDVLREAFPDLQPAVEDLFLLEAHEVAELPDRAPSRELAAVLHAYPVLRRFLIARHPPGEETLLRLMAAHPAVAAGDLNGCEQAVVWEVADWIIYERAPEYYDARSTITWDSRALTDVVRMDGAVVIDAGAGTGRVAFAVAPVARHIFAVEPVATLRRYMRDRAGREGISNVYVVDGFLHAIPIPAETADVLVTCHSIGWSPQRELAEIERVLRPGGVAVHLFGVESAGPLDGPLFHTLAQDGYRHEVHQVADRRMHRYVKHRVSAAF